MDPQSSQKPVEYVEAGQFLAPFPFPEPYDKGLYYYLMAPASSASFGFADQANPQVARLEGALKALHETDLELFRELARLFVAHGRLAAVFHLFLSNRDGSPQVDSASIRYYNADRPGEASVEAPVFADWAAFNRRLRGAK